MQNARDKKVSVIMVTRGTGDYVWPCLESLKRQTHTQLEIAVMDNSTRSDFAQELKVRYPHVHVEVLGENSFYCRSLNRGIQMSSADFIPCLNDDVILDEVFIEEALKGFEIHARIGMVSGKILRLDRKTIDSTGLFLTPWRTARERGYGLLDIGQFEREGSIFGVNGAVAFYRRSMLEDIKDGCSYFDEDYRIFYEDLDIAWRAWNRGWKGYYCPRAVAYHARGATVRQRQGIARPFARTYLKDELHAYLIKNRYYTIMRNESSTGLFLHVPCIFLYDFFMWSYIILCRPRLLRKSIFNLRFFRRLAEKRSDRKKLPRQ